MIRTIIIIVNLVYIVLVLFLKVPVYVLEQYLTSFIGSKKSLLFRSLMYRN